MPRGTRHDLVGLLLREDTGLVLDIVDGGTWRLDMGCLATWRAQRLIGRRVRVTGTRGEFDLIEVDRIEIAPR